MINENVEKRILHVCLTALLFLVCETYILPTIVSTEFVKSTIVHEHKVKRARFNRFEVVTNNRSFEVYEDLYREIQPNDTIYIKLSLITKSLMKIVVFKDGERLELKNGYITTFKGAVFVPLLLITITISLLFFSKFPWKPGRRNLIIIISLMTILQLYFYYINSRHY